MTTLYLGYPKCSTCKNAVKWLELNNHTFINRNIKEENPTAKELKEWHKKSNLPIKKFFNTSGILYREMGLKDKIDSLTLDEALDLLGTDGMLVKRPIVVTDDTVLLGFKEETWQNALSE